MANLNLSLFNFVFQLARRNAFLDAAGIFFARYFPYFLLAGVLWFLIREPKWRRRLFLFAEMALAVLVSRGIITELIRFFYNSPRPFDALHFASLIPESGNSFPSGHAAFYFALAAVIFFYNRRWGAWYFGLSALIGVSRIFAGVHWPSDVLGGALLGIASATAIHQLLGSYRKHIFSEDEHKQFSQDATGVSV